MSKAMTQFEWRTRFAPTGFRYVKKVIPFDRLETEHVRDLVMLEIDWLTRKLEREGEGRFVATVFTSITVYPRDIGESINHLDPLRPRFGIEIELRQPAAASTQT